MNDSIIAKLVEKFGGVVDVEAVSSAVSWTPWKREHLVEVADILIKLNGEMDTIIVQTDLQLQPKKVQFSIRQYTGNTSQHTVQPSTSKPRRGFSFKITTQADMGKPNK
jgi:hypothetical protein